MEDGSGCEVRTKEGASLVLLVNLVPPFLCLKEFADVSL